MTNGTLWSGRFDGSMDNSTLKFTSSLDTDYKLAKCDVIGSLAHVKMLDKSKIIPHEDAIKIEDGLKKIYREFESNKFELDYSLEDIHTNVEFKLTNIIGSTGGKLHTARSRNDQVATDFKMYLKNLILEEIDVLNNLMTTIVSIADKNHGTIMPGFTHMQHAQPVTLAQHYLAYFNKLLRDVERFQDCFKRINKCPLGSAALAGTTFPIDRKMTSKLLGFDAPTDNSMDTVSDRDFVSEILFCVAQTSIHLSSICEELIYWSSQVFEFIEMDDKYSTGSSIMPQKKNPDIAELIRGKTGESIGALMNLLTIQKGLPLTYNRDLQEDKKATILCVENSIESIKIMTKMISTMKINKKKMRESAEKGFVNATDLADYLVTKDVPFREAHGIVGESVRYCISSNKKLSELSIDEFKNFSEKIDNDVYEFIDVKNCVERRKSLGGTSSVSTKIQTKEAKEKISEKKKYASNEVKTIQNCWKKLLS